MCNSACIRNIGVKFLGLVATQCVYTSSKLCGESHGTRVHRDTHSSLSVVQRARTTVILIRLPKFFAFWK